MFTVHSRRFVWGEAIPWQARDVRHPVILFTLGEHFISNGITMSAARSNLLMCIARNLPKYFVKYAAHAVGLGFVGELVADVWNDYESRKAKEKILPDIQETARISPAEYRHEVEQVVATVGFQQPPAVRQAMATYLLQVPATIRRSLRRSADPIGTTVPAGLVLKKPNDLLKFLPDRLPRFKPGDRPLSGVPWELRELLGVGGFGEVWKAHNPSLPGIPPVALKFCTDRAAALVLTRHEARVLAQVMSLGQQPGIVTLRQAYLQNDPPCLEYEFVDGGDLTGRIEEWHQKGTPTSADAARIILCLAETLRVVHQTNPPIVHRDLKPANILVQRTRNGHQFKIADFGIGGLAAIQALRLATKPVSITMPSAVRGAHTPLYASPQQVAGEAIDPRDDIYSLGVIWWQILCGDLTKGAPTGLGWAADLMRRGMSEPLIRLLGSCVESRAEKRPANAAVLANHLASLLACETKEAKKLPAAVPVSNALLVDSLPEAKLATPTLITSIFTDAELKQLRTETLRAEEGKSNTLTEKMRSQVRRKANRGANRDAVLLLMVIPAAIVLWYGVQLVFLILAMVLRTFA